MKLGFWPWVVALGCVACAPQLSYAQKPSEVVTLAQSGPGESDLKPLTASEYQANIVRMEALADACKARAGECDPDKASGDFKVAEAGNKGFTIRRDWLRSALNDAKTAKDAATRADLMANVSARLRDDASEAGSPATTPATLPNARTKADAILSRNEFRHVEEQSWLSRQMAWFNAWLGFWLNRAFSHLPQSAWVVPVLEWGGLACAVAGLLLWAWRTTRQQRLALAAPAVERELIWLKESEDWARRADERAAAGDWREAVHCLYWAAIVMLEGRRLWRANRARTPREYLPLLDPGTPRHTALGSLTRIFERIWYGLRPATQSDFERAQAVFEALKAA